jgi:hemolysin activation/secretion protein
MNSVLDSKFGVLNGNVVKDAPLVDSESPKFKVKKIYFSGNTVVKDKTVAKLTSKYEGKEVNIEDLLNLCDQITAEYREQGYITSQAILQQQRVKDESVTITINEGRYGDVIVKGNRWARTSYLKRVLKAYNVKPNSVLNVYDLKNSVALLNKSTYMQGDMSIENSKEKNKNDVVLSIKDRYPLDFNIDWNNAGQEMAGRERGVFTLAQNNITGNGDALSLSAFLSNGTVGTFESYSIPVGTKGTKLVLGHSYSNTNYGGMYKAYGLNGKAQDFTVGISQQLYQGKKWTVDAGITLDFGHIKQTMNYVGNLNDVHMTVLRSGIYAKREDGSGLWLVSGVVNKGLPFMSYSEGHDYSDFVSANIGINRLQMLPKRCYLLFNLNGQYSPNDLFSSEKLMLGGYNIRGYEAATLLGDMGIYGTIELRTPVPFLKKVLKERCKAFEEQTKLGFFYDFGGVRDSTGYENYLTNKSINFIQSVGVGLHFPVGKILTANIDFGIPIGDKALIGQSARITFSITSSIHNLWCQKYNKSINESI